MDVTPLIPADRKVIDTYGPGLFRISNEVYRHPVLVFPDRVEPWAVSAWEEVTAASLAPVSDYRPAIEFLLIGSGPRMQLLLSAKRRDMQAAGLRADVMDTGAACRTYNVLLSEGRRVAAALLPA